MAEGDIGAVIDSLEFDIDYLLEASIIKITDTVVAAVYSGDGNDGWLKTFSVDSAGNIGDTVLDSLEFNAAYAKWPSICHVSGGIYAIAYSDGSNLGQLITVNVDADGVISNAPLDSWEFDSTRGVYNATLHISDGVIAIASSKALDYGTVFTVAINDAGGISKSKIDSLDFTAATTSTKQLVCAQGTKYAVVYTEAGNDGYVSTFDIAADGTISDTVIDLLEFATSDGLNTRVAVVNEGVLAIVSKDYWADGWLYTVGCDASGNLSDAVLDSWEFDPLTCAYPDVIKISDTVVTIVYSDGSNFGQALSVTISDAGIITKTAISTLEFESTAGTYCRLEHMQGNVYAVVFQGPDLDGWAKTFEIESPILAVVHHELCMGMGP